MGLYATKKEAGQKTVTTTLSVQIPISYVMNGLLES